MASPARRRSFESFIQNDLVQFSLADVKRSVPSAIDGLKPTQRKVLFACFKKGLLPTSDEKKVAELAGYCTEQTAYHHGEASMHATIVNMAQDYVGSNNVPLLEPCGQFGTRAAGGKDAASPRYIFTRLGPLTPLLFPEADKPVLEYVYDDGKQVEPAYYVPILPVLLLNGASGIGTGWSTQCHGYNPLEVFDNVLAHAEGRSMSEMKPWACGFEGQIEMRPAASSFVSRGVAEVTEEGVVVSELPLGRWTSNYKEWLQSQMADGKASWRSFSERHTEQRVCFVLRHTAKELKLLKRSNAIGGKPLVKALHLESSHSLANMHAYDADNQLRHFSSPLEVIEWHAEARLRTYGQRKVHELAALEDELFLHEAQSRFITMALKDELPSLFRRRPRQEVVDALQTAGFAVRPQRQITVMGSAIGGGGGGGVDGGGEIGQGGGGGGLEGDASVGGGAFDYLLRMPLVSLTEERIAKLEKQVQAKRKQVDELKRTTELQMWTRELEQLRPALEKYLEEKGKAD